MNPKKIKEGIFWVGAADWDRRLFDSLIPLPDGTSYNAYLVKGRDKNALIDTVDPSKADLLMSSLNGVDDIHYIISQHAEQDHSGAIQQVLLKYKNAKVITTPKGKGLLSDHLHLPEEKIVTVADGETLSLGDKTLEFIHTPWVHWPETMSTYLREDRILFTCDLFGSHLAFSDPLTYEDWKVLEASKRYYAEVMMPFRQFIARHMERFNGYTVDSIAPSHGPFLKNPGFILESHRVWVSENLKNMVVIPYVTMHGSTEFMVDHLAGALDNANVNVERFNLAVTDAGKLAMSLVDAATLVIGTPSMLTGAHPLAAQAAFLTSALRPKLKFASIVGSYGWGTRMVEQITGLLSGLKLEILEPVIVKGYPKKEDLASLERLAKNIAAKHRGNNIS